MKALYIFVLITFIFVKSFAQVFTAGDESCNYHLVNASYHATWQNGGSYFSNSYGFDIDGDGQNDISFINSLYPKATAYAVSSVPTVQFAIGGHYMGPWVFMKSFHFGDTINNQTYWKNLNSFSPSGINDTVNYIWYNTSNTGQNITFYMELPAYIGFRKIISSDTIYGWVYLPSQGYVHSYATKYASDTLPPPVLPAFAAPSVTLCNGDSLTLSATPPGGIYIGSNVSGNIFHPVPAGTYTVNYMLDNGMNCKTSASMLVNAVSSSSFVSTPTVMNCGDTLVLQTTPSGGIFNQSFVTNGVFYPPANGTYSLSYSVATGSNCTSMATTTIHVNSANSFISLPNSINCADTLLLQASPTGGSYISLNIVNGVFYPPSNGTYTLSYQTLAENNCLSTITNSIQVMSSSSFVNLTSKASCADSLVLIGSPPGGIFTGQSVSNGVFHPPSNGTYTLNYTVPTGKNCLSSTDKTVSVTYTASILNSQATICQNDSIQLAALPVGGTFSGPGVSNGYFHSYDNQGERLIIYNIGNSTCYGVADYVVEVEECTGLHELNSEKLPQVFPNPNAGSFEIKGFKDEIITIYNQLGSQLEILQLNQGNNFTVKISNYEKGVYFVVGNSYTQKIVVID